MSSHALFIIHQTLPGKRDEVKAIWLKHMAPAIQDNAGHLAYFYNFDNDNADSICAFQIYESAQAAKGIKDQSCDQQEAVAQFIFAQQPV